MNEEPGYAISRVLLKQDDEESEAIRWRLTERKVDRDGEVVEPAGGMLENYLANPIVLFAHGWHFDQQMVPIGKIIPDSIKQTKTFIDADVVFHDSGSDPFSAMIADKVRGGFLGAGSIGFKRVEVSDEPVLPRQTGVTFTKWELIEFSIVPVPSNARATRRSFDEFAGKCAEYGCLISPVVIDLVHEKLDVYGGILKALGPMPATRGYDRDEVMDALDRMRVDLDALKEARPGTGEMAVEVNDERDKDLVGAAELEQITLLAAMILTQMTAMR